MILSSFSCKYYWYKIEVFTSPFEVNEVGWGEFEAGIKIWFKNGFTEDGSLQSVEVVHYIRLYHPIADTISTNAKKPVISEKYDEIVFKNPPMGLVDNLTMYGKSRYNDPTRPYTISKEQYASFPQESECLNNLTIAYNFIQEELASMIVVYYY